MKSCAIFISCLLLLIGLLSASQADSKITQHEQVTILIDDFMYNLLGSKTFSYDNISPCQPTQPEPLSLTFTLGIDSQPGKTLFGDIPLIPNVGKTIWINASCANPDYSSFIQTLTDGRNDRLSGSFALNTLISNVTTNTTRVYEKQFTPDDLGSDFKGFRIGRIGIRIDAASVIQKPCTMASVPEPNSLSVMLAGLGCAAALWRRRRGI